MARKRKRRRLRAAPILWLLLIANVAIALSFSPATAATDIRVKGAEASDQQRIAKDVSWLKGRPWLSVNNASVEETLMMRPDVERAQVSRNPFGHAEVTMSYYRPVAIVDGGKNLVLTDGGFLCTVPNPNPNLPVLYLFPEASSPALGLSTLWEPTLVAQVCERAASEGIVKNLSITVTMSGSVCLNSGVTGRVIFGAPDDLDEKFSVMKKILTAEPNLLDNRQELVLVAPSKPVTRPLEGSPK